MIRASISIHGVLFSSASFPGTGYIPSDEIELKATILITLFSRSDRGFSCMLAY